MDLLSKFMNNTSYCDRIKSSSYEQSVNKDVQQSSSNKFPTVIELFFSVFDPHYIIIEPNAKELYVKQRIMDIATKLDEDKSKTYDRFNYLKLMNTTLIQQGLQSMKSVSSLLYLSDYYSVSTNIYVETGLVKVRTSDKVRKEFNITFKNHTWSELSVIPTYSDGTFDNLAKCLVMDVKTKDIYKKYLNPISKYKSPELIEIAKEMNLPLDNNGKKKVKKELYDDINLYQLNCIN
jgi:hypothetical protein